MKTLWLTLAILACAIAPASAHGLNVYAWLENDKILVQCDFGQGRPAMHTEVTVFDSVDRKELVRGTTNNQGRFEFAVPAVIRDGHGLTIVADAGQGHRGEWSMDAAEIYAAASLTAGFDAAAIKENQADHVHVSLVPASPPVPRTGSIAIQGSQASASPEQLRNMVAETLELKLAPIRQEIAKRSSSGPGMVEIIGGIGWIIGLVGIALYFRSRKSA